MSEATFGAKNGGNDGHDVCARGGDGTDVVVVCEGERTSEMGGVASERPSSTSRAWTERLLDGLENDSTAEAAASLAWADASMREREWVSAFAKRVRDIIVKKRRTLFKSINPRDASSWDAVSATFRRRNRRRRRRVASRATRGESHVGQDNQRRRERHAEFAVSKRRARERHLESNPNSRRRVYRR